MPKIVKYSLLKYISNKFPLEEKINTLRIKDLNNKTIKKGCVIYLIERELRLNNNPALIFAIQKAQELNLDLKIVHPHVKYNNKAKQRFIDNLIDEAGENFKKANLNFIIYQGNISDLNPALLIIDFNPILDRNYLKAADYKIYEIDGHNIIPARYISNKQEYGAMTMRRKIYFNISEFLTEFKPISDIKTEAEYILDNFIKNKLPYYAEFKNDFSKNIHSGLSKYLNLGFISSQKAAIEIIKSKNDDINKEIFLEELIIRKELADNFCLYCKNYKTFNCIPNWAKTSLKEHKQDIRPYIYNLKEYESAKTHDKLWNAIQTQLIKEGTIHGYLRMYWAKKILEWSKDPFKALKYAIYLNDKYAYDAPCANGYTGILWAMGALHDRAFKDYFITGKIRRMTYNSIKNKYDIKKYIEKFLC